VGLFLRVEGVTAKAERLLKSCVIVCVYVTGGGGWVWVGGRREIGREDGWRGVEGRDGEIHWEEADCESTKSI
jgi:hypothetical protein